MTDLETIFGYRMRQTEETLSEAVKMLESGFSPRSIVNRSYYAMFYAMPHIHPLSDLIYQLVRKNQNGALKRGKIH